MAQLTIKVTRSKTYVYHFRGDKEQLKDIEKFMEKSINKSYTDTQSPRCTTTCSIFWT